MYFGYRLKKNHCRPHMAPESFEGLDSRVYTVGRILHLMTTYIIGVVVDGAGLSWYTRFSIYASVKHI